MIKHTFDAKHYIRRVQPSLQGVCVVLNECSTVLNHHLMMVGWHQYKLFQGVPACTLRKCRYHVLLFPVKLSAAMGNATFYYRKENVFSMS